jgi:hypothetical protein
MRTIVWDVDDVLNNLMETWFTSVWKPAHAESRVGYSDIAENPPYGSLGISKDEYLGSLDEFRISEEARRLSPNPAVLRWLAEHGSAYRHVALTARPLESAPAAAEWVFRNFGAYFRCFGVVPSRPAVSIPLYDRDKGDFLEWLGEADCLIDDSVENLAAAQKLGIQTVLYPQPWNGAAHSVDEALRSISESVVLS